MSRSIVCSPSRSVGREDRRSPKRSNSRELGRVERHPRYHMGKRRGKKTGATHLGCAVKRKQKGSMCTCHICHLRTINNHCMLMSMKTFSFASKISNNVSKTRHTFLS